MRSMTGIEAFCAIRFYLAAATRHGIPWLDGLTPAAQGNPWIRRLGTVRHPRGGVRGNENSSAWPGLDGSNPLSLTRLNRRAGHVCAGGRVWLVHPAWPPSGPGPARSTRSDAAEDPARPACRTARTGATPARRSGLFCTGPHPSALHQSLSPRPLKAFSRCRRQFSVRSHAGSGRTATGKRTARRATGSGPDR
jgi:hypothetical protein